ncbi:sensor domain-containing protein [Paeniglutamicibacter cryotolerans]|uniref:Diguanylate cyclase (GGDEF)-like protein/PAS domain S-box-containing protein n=1 Tax=Paeniglutamicibacter cryotolerans TaxID=670079 RepID=A0A839QIE1_9MICC|nr:sensor domain-containing diguanylate cyclase [Paeniglutamicibacter cryotolerans]MBB2995630.1 diguanylate cyclase (GGDEF)-like protein/PAS domain S-box-containing protein [Paeniglutamicibacter cryotolerans]
MSQGAVDGVDYAQLFHQAPVGYIVASMQGTILVANATMCDWTGFQPGTLEGSRLLDILPVSDRLMYRTHAEPKLDRDGHLAELSLQLLGPDGSRLPVLLSVTRTLHGTVTRDLMVFFSAPERRRYERELATAHRRLEDAEAERTLLLDEARHRSLHDPLTGLPNRLHLQESLRAALAHAGGQHTRVGLLFCDVDDFKQVNDTLGHAAGDQVLQHIAHRLVAAVRSEDTVARISGDEFVVLIPGFEHPEELGSVAGRVRDSVASEIILGGTELRLSISVGRAETLVSADAGPADHQELANALLNNADKDMYRSKTARRGAPHRL